MLPSCFIPPLFNNQEEYDEFKARHEACKAPRAELTGYTGKCFLGVDAGSTTVKAVLLDEKGRLLDSIYQSNAGNPVPIIREYLLNLYNNHPWDSHCHRCSYRLWRGAA